MNDPVERNGVIVSAAGLSKTYQRGRELVRALDGATFEIRRGEFVAVTGPSGAGKSTLLNLVGCMDAPTSGTLHVGGKAVHSMTERDRTSLRRKGIGFVFQHFGLLPTLSVAENVALPGLFACRRTEGRVKELLEKVGLNHRQDHRPSQLSGGEMQRVAIARALVSQPLLLLADEPTGNLDTKTGESVIALFQQLNQDGLTIIVVTHNPAFACATHRRIELADGRISPIGPELLWRQAEAKMPIAPNGL